jgi:lipopolysaccharide biosynthesis glycosyltransferase
MELNISSPNPKISYKYELVNNCLLIDINQNQILPHTLFTIKSSKHLIISICSDNYSENHSIIAQTVFNIILPKNNFTIRIKRLFELIIEPSNIEFIHIQTFGNILLSNSPKPYQTVYSFDGKYFTGAFASIGSLIHNTSNTNLSKLCINILIPCEDYHQFIKHFEKFKHICSDTNINIHLVSFSFYLTNPDIIEQEIKETKCFKGGNHLLNIGNYSRLIIGHLFNYNKILYIDSDTIVQKDLEKVFQIDMGLNVILGKKSHLNLNNLFNSNNKHHFSTHIKNNSGEIFTNNIIYTGTMLVNPQALKLNYSSIMEIVKLHNKLLDVGGLYKLFTMSIINIGLFGKLGYFDSTLNNVVDLGCNPLIPTQSIDEADVLDWSGIYKPWFINGLFRPYWTKYNLMFQDEQMIKTEKNTIENFK